MFDLGFPPYWSTLKKLIWLVGSGVVGGAKWTTLTGAIVSFFAKKSAPINALSVTLEPIQDLHGQDAPYPAGGGANLAKPQVLANNQYWDYANDNGVYSIKRKQDVSSNPRQYFTASFADIGLADGETYTAYCFEDEQYSYKCGIYNGSGGMAVLDIHTTAYTFTYSASTMSNYRLGVWSNSPNTLPLNTTISFRAMLVKGSTTPSSFATYANICPITGWTGAKVTRASANLLKISQDNEVRLNGQSAFTLEYSDNNTVTMHTTTVGAYFVIWNLFKITPSMVGKKLTPSKDLSSTGTMRLCVADNWDSTITNVANSDYPYTIQASVVGKYIGIRAYNDSGTDKTIVKGMVSLEEDAQFENYDSEIIHISFGDTLYGCRVDFVNGKLYVTRKSVSINALSWTRQVASGKIDRYYTSEIASEVARTPVTETCMLDLASSVFKPSISPVFGRDTDNTMCVYGNTGYLYICASGYESADAFKTAFGSQTIVYPLAEPIEIQLTGQQINTLAGQNNIYGDGDVAVTIPSNIIVGDTP